MRDLENSKWMYLKAGLFLLIGLFATALLWLENPTWQRAVLLGLLVWAFCRLYYFAFYVIEKYIDPSYKFSGIISFLIYLRRRL